VEDKVIIVERKVQYGNERFFPVNGNAKKMVGILSGSTFTRNDLDVLSDFGLGIEVETKIVNFGGKE